MSEIIKITSITANTPVDVYYCDAMSASCVFVGSATTIPYEFVVPSPIDEQDFLIKLVDSEGCEIGEFVYITPTPTPNVTPTTTPTTTMTPTQTLTPSVTITQTPSMSPTFTPTTSVTPTLTPTPVISSHFVGMQPYINSGDTCEITMSILKYYTYISESNTIPVLGTTVYTFQFQGILYNPVTGNNLFYKMTFGSSNYAVQINNSGVIINFDLCI